VPEVSSISPCEPRRAGSIPSVRHTPGSRWFLREALGVTVAASVLAPAICGDLTSAFDFATATTHFPEPAEHEPLRGHRCGAGQASYPTAPAKPEPLFQEAGTGVACSPLPAVPIFATGPAWSRSSSVTSGTQGGVPRVRLAEPTKIPRRYTVQPKMLPGPTMKLSSPSGAYHLRVYGPNGFARYYYGFTNRVEPSLQLTYEPAASEVVLGSQKPARHQRSIVIEQQRIERSAMESWRFPRTARPSGADVAATRLLVRLHRLRRVLVRAALRRAHGNRRGRNQRSGHGPRTSEGERAGRLDRESRRSDRESAPRTAASGR